MNWHQYVGLLAVVCVCQTAVAQTHLLSQSTNALGFVTNGAVISEAWAIKRIYSNSPPTNLPPRFATNAIYQRGLLRDYTYTNQTFHSFQPDSLHHLIWTNFIAHTNGRSMRVWAERTHPVGWPKVRPTFSWNTNSLLWGLQGMTALSPCWAGEGHYGQVPLTALTRRHAYTRGHGMGPDGFNTSFAGRKAWFVAADNSMVEMQIARTVVRTRAGTNQIRGDYSIMLFDRDLPEKIETMRVARPEEVQKFYAAPPQGGVPRPIFETEQGGYVSTGVAPLTVNTWKGGDSGSPNMLLLPGELVFYSGRSTSGPNQAMQEDMAELCRLEKLDPAKYQMRWVDLGKLITK